MQYAMAKNPFMMMPITFARDEHEDVQMFDELLHHISYEEILHESSVANQFRAAEPVQ